VALSGSGQPGHVLGALGIHSGALLVRPGHALAAVAELLGDDRAAEAHLRDAAEVRRRLAGELAAVGLTPS
jgi:hypothetical protein